MGKTIGLIDDSKVMRSILRKAILMNNYQVDEFLEAEDGNQGLALLTDRTGVLDIAFVDLHMPGMGGLEMLRQVSDNGKLPVPVVVVSTSADAEMQNTVMALGAVGFIRKPFTPQDIGDLMQRVVGAAPAQ